MGFGRTITFPSFCLAIIISKSTRRFAHHCLIHCYCIFSRTLKVERLFQIFFFGARRDACRSSQGWNLALNGLKESKSGSKVGRRRVRRSGGEVRTCAAVEAWVYPEAKKPRTCSFDAAFESSGELKSIAKALDISTLSFYIE